ncbi:MAG: hypothetical protein ACYTF9_04575 [Planctomycetota bacterium]|jgi:lysylphosphatidylglycerol synthetase-like protein (DUF2156 family)
MPSRRANTLKKKAVEVTGQASIVITSTALLVVIGMLEFMSDPPRFMPDALWVRSHRGNVIVALISLLTAIVASLPGFRMRQTRWLMFAIWALGGAVLLTVFGDRAETIARVLGDRYLSWSD